MKLEHMQAATHRIRFVRKKGELSSQVVHHEMAQKPLNHPMFPIERPSNEHTRASSEDS
jgi:hypothetical protein